MRIAELSDRTAVARVRVWGYPREIDAAEEANSIWYEFGPHCVWWLNRNQWHEQGELSLHVCVHPAERGRVYARKFGYAVETVAELMGARRLVSWLPDGSEIGGYLRRMGWLPDPGRRGPDGHVAWVRELC